MLLKRYICRTFLFMQACFYCNINHEICILDTWGQQKTTLVTCIFKCALLCKCNFLDDKTKTKSSADRLLLQYDNKTILSLGALIVINIINIFFIIKNVCCKSPLLLKTIFVKIIPFGSMALTWPGRRFLEDKFG